MYRFIASLTAIALTGCAETHQQFAPLAPATMTPDDRVHTFMRLRPVTQTTTTENGSNPIDSSIILDDKTEVYLPEDLAPLVGDDSETMRAARASMSARTKSGVAWAASAVLLIGGAVLVFASDEDAIGAPPVVGYAAIGGALLGGIFVRHYNRADIDARRRAFAAYPRDLGARLNVCAHGLQVVACEGPLPAPSVPAALPVPAAPPPQVP